MKSTIKITKNPFAWLAFAAVAINIYAHFTITSIPLITYVLIGAVVMYALSNSTIKASTSSIYFWYMCLLIMYTIMVAMSSPSGSQNMTKMIIFQLILSVCFFIYLVSLRKYSDVLVVLMVVAVLILCVIIVSDEALFKTLSEAADDNTYYTLGENNRNTIGVILGIGSLYMLYLGVAKNKLWFLAMIATVALGLITGSRKVIVSVVFGMLLFTFLYVTYAKKQSSPKKLRAIIFVLLIIGLLLFFCFNNETLYNIIGNRIEGLWGTLSGSGEGDASSEERAGMIKRAFEMFLEKPAFGWGIEGFAKNSGYGVYSHNNFTETLVSFGIFGFVLFYSYKVALLVMHFCALKREIDKNKCAKMVIVFVAMAISLILDFAAISMNNIVVNIPYTLAAAQIYLNKLEKRTSK